MFDKNMALEDIAKGMGKTLLAVGGLTATTFVATTAGAFIGGMAGQFCDLAPYLNHAIPEGIAYIGNAFTEGDSTRETINYLTGNLDKVGAVAGFFGVYFKSALSNKKED